MIRPASPKFTEMKKVGFVYVPETERLRSSRSLYSPLSDVPVCVKTSSNGALGYVPVPDHVPVMSEAVGAAGESVLHPVAAMHARAKATEEIARMTCLHAHRSLISPWQKDESKLHTFAPKRAPSKA